MTEAVPSIELMHSEETSTEESSDSEFTVSEDESRDRAFESDLNQDHEDRHIDYDPSNDIIPPLDVDPGAPLEFQLRAACLHVLKDRAQKGAVAFGFGFLLHRLDPAVRARLDNEASVNPDFITATPRQFDQWLVKNASQLGLKAFVPPGGGRAEYRLLAVPPSHDELELVQKLREQVTSKKCISVGDFYREIIKPDLNFRAVVNTTFGADSARFARCHPEVCTVLANRFIMEPMPPTNFNPKFTFDADKPWIAAFLVAVRAFMKCQRHAIPVSCVSQAFAPWKIPAQAIWGSWKGMFDENPNLFYISAAGSVTGRADLYAIVEGDIDVEKALASHSSERRQTNWQSWARRGRNAPAGRGNNRGGHVNFTRQQRPATRSEKSDNWRNKSKSADTSPENPPPQPRSRSGPSSPSGTFDSSSPVKFPPLEEIPPTSTSHVFTIIHVDSARAAISALSVLKQMKTLAFGAFGITETIKGTEVSAIAITSRSRELPKLPVYVFDLERYRLVAEHLRSLFEDNQSMKIVHGGTRDCKAISSYLKVAINPFTDTEIMYRLLPEAKDLDNPSENVPLNTLLSRYKLPVHVEADATDGRAGNFWDSTVPVVEFAARQVAYLIDVYECLLQDLGKLTKIATATLSSTAHTEQSIAEGTFADANSLIAAARAGKQVPFEISFVRHKPIRVTMTRCELEKITPPKVKNVENLLAVLPSPIAKWIQHSQYFHGLQEVVFDIGKLPTLVTEDGAAVPIAGAEPVSSFNPLLRKVAEAIYRASSTEVSDALVQEMIKQFDVSGRLGIPGTLHKIIASKNQANDIIGLSFHVGMHFSGYGMLIEDVIDAVNLKKTSLGVMTGRLDVQHCASMMRDIACTLASHNRKVIVLDTTEMITGSSDIPFDGIGKSRRMLVPKSSAQHIIISQIVANHRPDAIVVAEARSHDVIGAIAAAESGTAMITGIPALNGIAAIQAKSYRPLFGKFGGRAKTNAYIAPALRGQISGLKCQSRGIFEYLIEIVKPGHLMIYSNIEETVERLLNGQAAFVEERWVGIDGKVVGRFTQIPALDELAVQDITQQ